MVTFLDEASLDKNGHLDGHEKAFKYLDTGTTCAAEYQGPLSARYLPKCRRALHHLRFIFNGTSMKNPRKEEPPLTAQRLLERLLEEVLSDNTGDLRDPADEGQRPIFAAEPQYDTHSCSRTSNLVLYRPKGRAVRFVERSFSDDKGAYIPGGDPPAIFDFEFPAAAPAVAARL